MNDMRKILTIVVALAVGFVLAGAAQAALVTSGLDLWLDANDTAGTGTPAADGTLVATWVDKAGTATNATQSEIGVRPTVQSVDGKKVVRFNGVDDWMELAGTVGAFNYMHDGTDNTMFAVVRRSTTGSHNAIFQNNNGAAGLTDTGIYLAAYADLGGGEGNAVMYKVWRGSGYPNIYALRSPDGSFPTVTTGIIATRQDYSGTLSDGVIDAAMRINGTVQVSVDIGSPFVSGNAHTELQLGTMNEQYFKGDIAEILFYNRALSDAELNETGNYLGTKYGITWVPEPATMGLLGIGGLLVLVHRVHGRRRR